MAATCPSDTELEERGDCESTIELSSDNVEEIGLEERQLDYVLRELEEDGGCHEKSEEDWGSMVFEDSKDYLNILENFNTDFNIETDTSKRYWLPKEEDGYKFTKEDAVMSQLSVLKEQMMDAGENYKGVKEEELGFSSTAEDVFRKEVTVKLIWDDKDITKRNPRTNIRSGDSWGSIPRESLLLQVEAQVRDVLCCRDRSKQIFLKLQEEGKEDFPFFSDTSLSRLGCQGDEVTILCSAFDSSDGAWATVRPKGPLLQASRDDTVEITVKFYNEDFQQKEPIKLRWGKNSVLEPLESYLRGNLVPKNNGEKLFIHIQDPALPGGWAYFYGFMTPKQLRLSKSSVIFCVGLTPPNQTYKHGDGGFGFEGFRREKEERFGKEKSTEQEQVSVKMVWSPMVVECLLPMAEAGSVCFSWDMDKPLLELESFLRTHFRYRVKVTIFNVNLSRIS